MYLTISIIIVLLVLLVISALKAASYLKKISEFNDIAIKCLDAHETLLRKIHEENSFINESLSRIQSSLDETERKISNISYVMDVIYKYKLPSKKDRDFLDRVEIDNEVFDGINSARD